MKNSYKFMVAIGFIIWFAETAYFGWNETAQSAAERILDMLSLILIYWGVIGDIAANLQINKTVNVKAETVEIVRSDSKEAK